MLRVKSTFIVENKEDNKLYFQDALYSGLVYQVGPDGVLQEINIIEQGLPAGFSQDYLNFSEGCMRIDESFFELEEDYGPYRYQGFDFTGVSYYFAQSGQCVAETDYICGYETEINKRTWYLSGARKELLTEESYIIWFEDGCLQTKTKGEETIYKLITQNDLVTAIINQDRALIDIETIRRFNTGEELSLVGRAIDNNFVSAINAQPGLSTLRHLTLRESKVDRQGLEIMVSLPLLTSVSLKDNSLVELEDARYLKNRRPNCNVFFNDQPVGL